MKKFNWLKLLVGFIFAANIALTPYYFFITGEPFWGLASLGFVAWYYFDSRFHNILFKQRWFKDETV